MYASSKESSFSSGQTQPIPLTTLSAKFLSAMPRDTSPPIASASNDHLHQQAFDNSLQANIIFRLSDGSIIAVNQAACKLLGYSKKALLTRNRKDIFNSKEGSYKAMLRQRKTEGSATADLSMIKKNGKQIPCAITSVIFKNEKGICYSILSIVDMSERLLKQQKIDAENQKVVADNIVIAQSRSDIRQEENDNWIQSISRSSYDLLWDWDVTADLLFFGNNYEKASWNRKSGSRKSKSWRPLSKPRK